MLIRPIPLLAPSHSTPPKRVRAATPLLILAFAFALGCDAATDVDVAPLPNIVLVTLDTTRADHLGSYGYFRNTSPRFDAFAAESVVFDRLIVPMATTLPSHLSILTSSHPLEHGVLANTTQGGSRFVPAPGLTSFAVSARDAGYATGAFVSAAPLKRGSGIEVGFDTFDQPEDKNRIGEQTASAALRWLSGLDPEQPYFLWVHFYDAHFPFEAPPPYAGTFRADTGLELFITKRKIHATATRPLVGVTDDARQVANAYDDELLYQDAQLAAVLDAVRSHAGDEGWSRTAVVVTGDHGEGLCQHGEAAHGGTWDEQLNAPLAIRVPRVPPSRSDVLVTSSDILPTTLGLLGRVGGADLGPFEEYTASALGNDVLSEVFAPSPILSQDTGRTRGVPFKYALTDGDYKYFLIENSDGSFEERLYDLGVDPHELRDVSGSLGEMLEQMRERTRAAIDERIANGKNFRGDAGLVEGDPDLELLAELCALGYIEQERCAELDSERSE